MLELDPRDAAIVADLEQDAWSGVRLLTLDEAAAMLAKRERVTATFTKRRLEPACVVIGGDECSE